MSDRETRLDELEAAFAKVPVPPVSTLADLAEAERERASRHFGFTPEAGDDALGHLLLSLPQ